MTYFKSSILFLIITIFSGCGLFGIQGSGEIVETTYSFDNFTSVSASNTCEITIMQGDEFSVNVSIDDNVLPYVETYMEGNVLHIDLESFHNYWNIDFSATVIMPEISYVEISGASSASVTGFENTGTFTALVSGASNAQVNFIQSGSMNCEVSGASSLKITSLASAGDLDLLCTGASTADLRNLHLSNGAVEVSGASTAYIEISGSLTGEISGASTLYYSGNPSLGNLQITGGSRLDRIN